MREMKKKISENSCNSWQRKLSENSCNSWQKGISAIRGKEKNLMKILRVVGARPNFMKAAPIMREMAAEDMARHPQEFEQLLVHTGQHYGNGTLLHNMSKVFFEDLELPQPDIYLGVGSGSHAQQTARVMPAFQPVLLEHRPDWVIVASTELSRTVEDVNSTVACVLTAAKLGIKVAHVAVGSERGGPAFV